MDRTESETRRIVITGGTRGIGQGLVRAFANHGWEVHYTGRTRQSVDASRQGLPRDIASRCFAYVCEADDAEAVRLVWDSAVSRGRVDVWLCNAGVSHPHEGLHEYSSEEIHSTINTNLVGPIVAAQIVLPQMRAAGGGTFYVMEGFGSRGEQQKTLALYGASKYAASYITKSLANEYAGTGVNIGALSPGMVITDMLLADVGGLKGAESIPAKTRKIYSILADPVSSVSPWLADRVVADFGKSWKGVRRHAWLTTPKIIGRFMSAGFVKRDPFGNTGKENQK